MAWHKDGSGLEVKRVRGMTLPQWALYGLVREGVDFGRGRSSREVRRTCRGRRSNVDSARNLGWEAVRQRHRDRRAKRLAKAAEKRFLDTVRPMGVDLGPKGLEVLTAAALDVGLTDKRLFAWRMPHG
jgi:hypothetical protein